MYVQSRCAGRECSFFAQSLMDDCMNVEWKERTALFFLKSEKMPRFLVHL